MQSWYADGQAWEKADVSKEGPVGDQSTWGKVSFPSTAGRIVQVSGGKRGLSLASAHGSTGALLKLQSLHFHCVIDVRTAVSS